MELVTVTGRFQQVLAYASGTGARTGTTTDMQLWANLCCLIEVHSVGASESITATLYESDDSGMSGETAVPNATLTWTSASTPLQIMDHSSVTKRYTRVKITKTPGSNASAESAVFLRYEPKLAVAENNTSGVAATIRTRAAAGVIDPTY